MKEWKRKWKLLYYDDYYDDYHDDDDDDDDARRPEASGLICLRAISCLGQGGQCQNAKPTRL